MIVLDEILSWCRVNAALTGASVRPSASEDDLHAAQRRTGGWNWPEDVQDFYSSCDGTERTPAGYLFPRYRPLPLGEVVDTWEMLVTISDGLSVPEFSTTADHDLFFAQHAANPGPEAWDHYRQPAGEQVGRFITPFLPIAEDQSGSFLVVDRRRGRRFGAIVEYDKVDADLGSTSWHSLMDVLGEVAAAMREPAGAGHTWVPASHGGCVTWSRGSSR